MTMHGQNHLKFIYAKQAKAIHEYKSLKRRLYNITAAIWYNKICREKHLTPKYISIRVNGNSRQCNNTLKFTTRQRINQKSQAKPAALQQTLGMCCPMAHVLDNYPTKHRQHFAT
jgi:hypothetical protein